MTNAEKTVEEIVRNIMSYIPSDLIARDVMEEELTQTLTAERRKREEMVEYGRVSVLEDFDALMKADAFMGLTYNEWKAVQKFFRYNDEISGWKLTHPNNK